MKTSLVVVVGASMLLGWGLPVLSLEVKITPDVDAVEVLHAGEKVTVQRNQDRSNRIKRYYSYTSRRCPPFCLQPIQAAPGVETVGELEVLDYLRRRSEGDASVMVVDTRLPKWTERGMIPGAINVPWPWVDEGADPDQLAAILARFGVKRKGQGWDFSGARTVVMYCNGVWCSQSNHAVHSLLQEGYPADKLKWYRGGMQDWESVGLTTVKAE